MDLISRKFLLEEFEKVTKKAKKRGGFKEKIFLEKVLQNGDQTLYVPFLFVKIGILLYNKDKVEGRDG